MSVPLRRSSPPAAAARSAVHPFAARFSPTWAQRLRHLGDWLENVGVALHDIAVLEGATPRLPRSDGRLSVSEHRDPRDVAAAYGRVERPVFMPRVGARFRAGFRFFELSDPTGTAGYGWFDVGAERYLDELALRITVPKNALWVRDVYIHPSRRGRGYFGGLLAHVAAAMPERTRLLSDVDWDNVASLRAHENVGFVLRGRLRAVNVGERWIWRRGGIPEGFEASGFHADRRLVHLGKDELLLHRELCA